jgi:hypothetical protein
MAASMKMANFWVLAPCSLVDDCPDDGGSKHLRNVGKLLLDYMVQQPRRQPSTMITSSFQTFLFLIKQYKSQTDQTV